MISLSVRVLFVACGIAMAADSIASGSVVSTAPTSKNACSILVGGGGAVFTNDAQNNKWFLINRAVSRAVVGSLQDMGYRIQPLIADIRDNEQRLKMLSAEVSREKCGRVIQITHGLSGESATMPGVAKNFEFNVSVLGISQDNKLTGIFQKTYSYPLTKEVMETLSMKYVGKLIATDIDKARVINKVPQVNESSKPIE